MTVLRVSTPLSFAVIQNLQLPSSQLGPISRDSHELRDGIIRASRFDRQLHALLRLDHFGIAMYQLLHIPRLPSLALQQ